MVKNENKENVESTRMKHDKWHLIDHTATPSAITENHYIHYMKSVITTFARRVSACFFLIISLVISFWITILLWLIWKV